MSDNTKYITLTNENFQREVLESTVPVLVDFWAAWCGPCRMLDPIIRDIAADFAGIAKVGKVNIDDYPQLATEYNISAIPTLVFFQNGQVVERMAGIVPKQAISQHLNALSATTAV